jgi:hypothetical protein
MAKQNPALAAAELQIAETKTTGAKAPTFICSSFGTTQVVP